MPLIKAQNRWIPYIVVVVGLLFSIFLWYVFTYDIEIVFGFQPLEPYYPWIALFFGISVSILLAVIIWIAQLAQMRALTLKDINEDLKKEISDRIVAEETRQKLEIALLQGQKLQAIGTLAGGIAHDFNNILYAIIGYIEMAREDAPKNTVLYKNLGNVLEAAHRGQELIFRILDFSRRQHHHFDEISLKSTIEAALSLLRPTIPASVIIHFEATNYAMILGNQTQIHQVLVNIINNAVDAMEGEGTINITLSRILFNDPFLKQFPDLLPQNYCKIKISDTGHGMDQATLERIFEPFFTTKEVGKGTGLGLSIVHSIIKDHQGNISVQSRLGRGTTILILLPEFAKS